MPGSAPLAVENSEVRLVLPRRWVMTRMFMALFCFNRNYFFDRDPIPPGIPQLLWTRSGSERFALE
jgi:hypothetical protein